MKLVTRTIIPALSIALIVLSVHPAGAAAPARREPRMRLTSIDLAVDVDFERERLTATALVEVENLEDVPASELSLLLGRLMRFERVETADRLPLPFRQEVVTFDDSPKKQVNQAIVDVPAPVPPHGRTKIRVAYSGYLVGYTETGSLYIKDHVDPEFTILRSDAYAFPVVGVASDARNRSIPLADFAFDVRATVPHGWIAANGGELVEREDRGPSTTWRYRSDAAPFLNVAIAKYDFTEKNGIRMYAFPADREGAARVLDRAQRAVELFRTWFGPTAAPAHFAVIEIPADGGSQASIAGGIIQTASTFQDPDALIELYHEISHFWNPRDLDSPSPRINEGLAMYLQLRAAQDIDSRTDLDARLNRRVGRVLEGASKEPRLPTIPMADYGKADMTDWSYSVGQLMFGLLERVEGPERFRAIVGGFYQKYKETGATTAEFIAFAGARGGPAARRLLADWLTSTVWLTKLQSGETLDAMARRCIQER